MSVYGDAGPPACRMPSSTSDGGNDTVYGDVSAPDTLYGEVGGVINDGYGDAAPRRATTAPDRTRSMVTPVLPSSIQPSPAADLLYGDDGDNVGGEQ